MALALVLYNTAADPATFDRYYHQTHIPLAQKIPGLRSYVISSGPVQALAGTPRLRGSDSILEVPLLNVSDSPGRSFRRKGPRLD